MYITEAVIELNIKFVSKAESINKFQKVISKSFLKVIQNAGQIVIEPMMNIEVTVLTLFINCVRSLQKKKD
jgi:translation elongation factor EF-G